METVSNRTEDIEILKWILGKAYRAERRKILLDNRLKRIREEVEGPIGGKGYSPLPRAKGKQGSGAAGIMARISEIEERIYAQKSDIEKTIVKTMDILEYLPKNSTERDICEMRHIDMMPWPKIQDEVHISRSQCFKIYRDALDGILQNERIQKIVEEHREEYEKTLEEKGAGKNGAKKTAGKKLEKKSQENSSGKNREENKGDMQDVRK